MFSLIRIFAESWTPIFTWSKTLLFMPTIASLDFGVADTQFFKLRFRFLGVVDSYFSDIDIPLRTNDGRIDCMGRCCCWSIPGKYLPGHCCQHYLLSSAMRPSSVLMELWDILWISDRMTWLRSIWSVFRLFVFWHIFALLVYFDQWQGIWPQNGSRKDIAGNDIYSVA